MFKISIFSATNVLVNAFNDFNGEAYIALSRQEKLDKLWDKVIEDDSSGTAHTLILPFTNFRGPLDTAGDEMYCRKPGKCNKKVVHPVGSVAKVRYVDKGGHPYTGMFKGADSGLARFSTGSIEGATSISPGIGVKFLRDGHDSANYVAMDSLDGQNSFNFFEYSFETHLPVLSPSLVNLFGAIKFAKASLKIFTIGLSEYATYT